MPIQGSRGFTFSTPRDAGLIGEMDGLFRAVAGGGFGSLDQRLRNISLRKLGPDSAESVVVILE
jgi:hypothetical protein